MVLLEGIDIGWLLIVSGALLLLVEVYSPGFCYGTGYSDDLFRYIISAGGRCLQFWPGSRFWRNHCNLRSGVHGMDVWEDHDKRKSDYNRPRLPD